MDVSPLSTTAPASKTSVGKSDGSVLSSDFETFLKMLTAQARYQDPLEPIDSTEYAAQLAQFSSVEQQVKGNELLSSIATQLGAGNITQFAGWIGMDARSTAPIHFNGTPITLSPKPATAADAAFLIVRDSDGQLVERRQIPLTEGEYQWTGQSADGEVFPQSVYSFTLESRAADKVISTTPLETYAKVTEARSQDGGAMLVLEGGSVVEASKVTALRQPIEG